MTDPADDRFDRFLLVLRQALLMICTWIERETGVRGAATRKYEQFERFDPDGPAAEP